MTIPFAIGVTLDFRVPLGGNSAQPTQFELPDVIAEPRLPKSNPLADRLPSSGNSYFWRKALPY